MPASVGREALGVRSMAMDAQTVAGRLDELQVVDVRYADDWRAGHIDGSANIPEEDLPERVEELDRSRAVVTVCRAGTRSADAAEWLRGQGFDAQSLDGGMLAWKWAGFPITAPVDDVEVDEVVVAEMQALHDEFVAVAMAIEARFGVGVEPTEAQIREFLRERMIDEGRTPEEADAYLAEMGGE